MGDQMGRQLLVVDTIIDNVFCHCDLYEEMVMTNLSLDHYGQKFSLNIKLN